MNEFRELNGSFLRMDLRDIGKLYDWFKRYPVLARPTVAQFLNDVAFSARPLIVSTLASRLIMRAPKFILSRMVVVKTTARPIAQQKVTVGSTYARGKGGTITFDGFRSLEGLAPEKSRTMTLFARGGDRAGIAQRSARLLPGDIPSTDDSPVTTGSRLQYLLRDMATNAPNKPFIVRKGLGFAPGLYRVSKTKRMLPSGKAAPMLQIVQRFDRNPKARVFHWMQDSMRRLINHAPIAKMWDTAISKTIRESMRKEQIKQSASSNIR